MEAVCHLALIDSRSLNAQGCRRSPTNVMQSVSPPRPDSLVNTLLRGCTLVNAVRVWLMHEKSCPVFGYETLALQGGAFFIPEPSEAKVAFISV